jgi:hypothetical protein
MRGAIWLISIHFCLLGEADASARWQTLLQNDPFVGPQPPKPPPPEAPPVYEFRGRSVENGVEYFSLYDLNAKTAFWVSGQDGDLRVVAFKAGTGLELTDRAGQTIRLALKDGKPARGGSVRARATVGLASTVAAVGEPAVAAVAISPAESQRLEGVASQVRARRAQRQQQPGRG